jgi:arginase
VIAVLDAPSNLGLRPLGGVEPGVKGLAGALRSCGVVSRLGARDAGVVAAPPYSFSMEANRVAMAGYTRELAARIGDVLGAGDFPVVLGGDCSILLGAGVALKRRGRFGLAFVDGHLDFRNLSWAPAVGAVAGEDLAVVTGRAEPSLADIDGLGPYFAEKDVVALGEREGDVDERRALAETAITVRDLAALRRDGLLLPHGPYWIHCDADVLDISAVDSPAPGGLAFEELTALLRVLLAGDAVGLQVTVFDPSLDPDGSQARGLTDCLVAAFEPSRSRWSSRGEAGASQQIT